MVFCLNLLTSAEPKHNTNSKPRLPFLKPKPSTGSAFCPVISKSVSSYDSGKRASLCSQEVCRTMSEFKQSLNGSIASQLLDPTKKGRPYSPIPDDKGQDFTSAETPHAVRSLKPEKNIRPISPNQLVVFPPEIPSQYRAYSKSPTPEFPQKPIATVEPEFKTTFKTNSQAGNVITQCTNADLAELKYLPKFHGRKGPISTAMEIAPDRPFTPVAVTEPIIKPAPWISLPLEDEYRSESPLIDALKTAPERSYSPLPTFVYASELEPTPTEDSNKEVRKPFSITETPILAQNSNFKLSESKRTIGNNPVKYMHGYNNKNPVTLLQSNTTLSQHIPAKSSSSGQKIGMGINSSLSNPDTSIISGPYEPVKIKSNYNEAFITRVPDFKSFEKSHSANKSTILNQNLPLNNTQYQNNILIPQESSSSVSNRSIGLGIKNKVSTFTPNTSASEMPFSKQTLNDHNKIIQNPVDKSTSTVDNSYTYKSKHPNSIKLVKAVPFFSNSTTFPSTPTYNQRF